MGCDCEQVKNPVGRGVLLAIAAIAIIGLGKDVVAWLWDKFADKKPPKHVMSPKGYKMVEKISSKNICDVSGKRGTHYTCSGGSNYDLSLESYKAAKKKPKQIWRPGTKSTQRRRRRTRKREKRRRPRRTKKMAVMMTMTPK